MGHSAKKFILKEIKNLCRVLAGLALGKETVNGAAAVTVAFLCRVPPGLSAKPLPSANGSLPSVKTLGKVAASSSDLAKALPRAPGALGKEKRPS